MADKTTTTHEFKLVAAFADEDDRTLTLPNPISGISAADISSLQSAAASVLIGDKYGAQFTRFKRAFYYDKSSTTYDLT